MMGYIGSRDEMPEWLDMPASTTVLEKRASDNEHLRFTVVVVYTADGKKQPPSPFLKEKICQKRISHAALSSKLKKTAS